MNASYIITLEGQLVHAKATYTDPVEIEALDLALKHLESNRIKPCPLCGCMMRRVKGSVIDHPTSFCILSEHLFSTKMWKERVK